ncbi:MAG: energy-coupling factor transporter transmembrane component T family protein [Chloroflexota bacterium]
MESASAREQRRATGRRRAIWQDWRRLTPGQGGRLAAFAATVALAVMASGWRALGGLALAVLLALLLSRAALAQAARDRTWPLLGLGGLLLALLGGEPDLAWGGLAVSSAGLGQGAQMVARALAILLATYTLTTAVSLPALAALIERAGLKGFGFALGVAVNALPLVQRHWQETTMALRLRGGFRKQRWRALRLALLTTVVNAVAQAEDTVAAASARGYQGETLARGIPWSLADSLFTLALAGAVLGIILL